MKKLRVRYTPRTEWYVVEEKRWFGKWKFLDAFHDKDRAIKFAEEYIDPTIIWESKDD